MVPTHQVLLTHPSAEVQRDLLDILAGAGLSAAAVDRATILSTTASWGGVILAWIDPFDPDDLALLRALRRGPAREASIIALLSQATDPSIRAALEDGADDCVAEPYHPAELVGRVRSQLRLRAYTDELALGKQNAEVMLELTQTLASSLDFRDILYTVVRRIAQVIEVGRVSIVLVPEGEPSGVGYVVVASDDEQLTNLKIDLGKYPEIQQVFRSREALHISDPSTHPVLDGIDTALGEMHPMSLFPIVWEREAIGVLYVRAQGPRAAFTERERQFCQIVANATAVALRNAHAMQGLRDRTQQVTFARFEAERKLQALERYADLFDSAAEGIAAIDRDGRVLFANPRAHDILGLRRDVATGKRLMSLIYPSDRDMARRLWARFQEGSFPRAIDLRVMPSGAEAPVTCSCSFAPLGEGEGTILISFQDVTDQRRTEAELIQTMEFLESLVDASVDGIIAADMRGTIILFNPSAERIYGHRAQDVIGKMSARDLYPGDGAREVLRRLQSPEGGGPGRLAPTLFEAQDRSGAIFPIQISAAIIYENGVPAATFGIFTDMREKRAFEERLAEAQHKLAMTEKQALIAELAGTAAHELNQPLTSIMAYAELLKRKLPAGSSERRAADVMVQESERMAEIVRQIGTITRYETKSYVGDQQILDLDKSSARQSAPPSKERR